MTGKSCFGLLGQKLSHSYSVEVHRLFGCKNYFLFEKEPDELDAFFEQTTLSGFNVTVPYKKEALLRCDTLSNSARDIGAVNTVIRRPDGTWHGENTDLFGFLYLVRYAGLSLQGKKVLIFGSGGASLTVQAAARLSGASSVVEISRSGPENYKTLDRHADAQILVNATPVGMFPSTNGRVVDLYRFFRCEGVLDLVYNPRLTMLLVQAKLLRLPFCDGLPMLVAQAAEAERLLFNKEISEGRINQVIHDCYRTFGNIVLVGMPGAGKSTVGRLLAKMTGKELIDIDSEIEKKEKRSIPDIFRTDGEATFRLLEKSAIAEAGNRHGVVIVTGGGAVMNPENLLPLQRNGRVYEIRRALDRLAIKGRPLSENCDLLSLFQERIPLYTAFADTVISNDGSPAQTAEQIKTDFYHYF